MQKEEEPKKIAEEIKENKIEGNIEIDNINCGVAIVNSDE